MIPLLAILVSLAGPGSGEVSLETHLVGHGCCSADHPPTLAATLTEPGATAPARSVTVRFSGSGAPRSETGWLLAGPRPVASHPLGNGGFLHLAPAAMWTLHLIDVDAAGKWASDVVLPAGVLGPAYRFTVQAAFQDPEMSIDFALSDAVEVQLEVQ